MSICISVSKCIMFIWNIYMIMASDVCSDMKCVHVYYLLCVGFSHWAISSPSHSIVSVWPTGIPQMDRLISRFPPPLCRASQKNEESGPVLDRDEYIYDVNVYEVIRMTLIYIWYLTVVSMFSYEYVIMTKYMAYEGKKNGLDSSTVAWMLQL